MGEDTKTSKKTKKKAPTLYGIIVVKLIKGVFFAALALAVFRFSDRDLPEVFREFLTQMRVNPERRFWTELADRIGELTTSKVRWAAAGTLMYSLFSLVEGVGLMFRVPWVGWLTIGESAFFIPIEIFELLRPYSGRSRSPHLAVVAAILVLNIFIVVYLYRNRERLFRH